MREEQCCGTCKFHMKENEEDYICTNGDSEYVADWTEYNHTCDEWEEREQ